MRMYNLYCGITTTLSNAEHNIVEKISSVNIFSSENLDEQEEYVVEELVRKGIVDKTIKDGIEHYYIETQELDREPLN